MRKTGVFLLGLVVVALAWEGYAAMYPGHDVALITDAVRAADADTGGLIGFLLGGLCGHLFFCRTWGK